MSLLAGVGPAQADRGAIPFRPKVTIFELTQRALMAWNGEEGILLYGWMTCSVTGRT